MVLQMQTQPLVPVAVALGLLCGCKGVWLFLELYDNFIAIVWGQE